MTQYQHKIADSQQLSAEEVIKFQSQQSSISCCRKARKCIQSQKTYFRGTTSAQTTSQQDSSIGQNETENELQIFRETRPLSIQIKQGQPLGTPLQTFTKGFSFKTPKNSTLGSHLDVKHSRHSKMYQQGSFRVAAGAGQTWKDSNNAMDSYMSATVAMKPQIYIPEQPKHIQLNRYLNNGFLNKEEFEVANQFSTTS